MKAKRIGIFAGTFDPVHAGHVTFALQALQAAKLDKVYFLPERRPRSKRGVEHFAHRVAMLKEASRPHARFDVLELDDVSFSVKRTLPALERLFPGSQLFFLLGSDSINSLTTWPLVEQLLARSQLIIGLRAGAKGSDIDAQLQELLPLTTGRKIIKSFAPHVSSGAIRDALRARRYTPGLLRSVARYSNRHWLYVSLE